MMNEQYYLSNDVGINCTFKKRSYLECIPF